MKVADLNNAVWLLATKCKQLDAYGRAYRAYVLDKNPTLADGDELDRYLQQADPIVSARYKQVLDDLKAGKEVLATLRTFFASDEIP